MSRISDDFDTANNNRADYIFGINSNDEGFTVQELKLKINLRPHITAYPSTVNINIDDPSGREEKQEQGFSSTFYLSSETGESFRIKRVYSEMKELSFDYAKDVPGPRHIVELTLSPSHKYKPQETEIIAELEYDRQNIVKIPVFLLRRK